MNDVLRKQQELMSKMRDTYQRPGSTWNDVLAVARQAHAEEMRELIYRMLGGKVYANVAEFAEELGSRFLAQQETKTPEERVTIRGRSLHRDIPEYWEVCLDGQRVFGFDQHELKDAERYAAGFRAELAGKETK